MSVNREFLLQMLVNLEEQHELSNLIVERDNT